MYRARLKGGPQFPRLREWCRPSQAEVVSKSRSKNQQSWGPSFSRALYVKICINTIQLVADAPKSFIRLFLCVPQISLAVFLTPNPRIYELYTSATGIYLCLLAIKLSTLTTGWIQQGWAQLSQKVKEWAIIVSSHHDIISICCNRTSLVGFFTI